MAFAIIHIGKEPKQLKLFAPCLEENLDKEIILQLAKAEDLDICDQIDYFEKVLNEWLNSLRPELGDVIND